MQESACASRLSIVLREMRYPARTWMIPATAERYGADVQSRIELQDLPEAIYHDIDEVVAAVTDRRKRLAAIPQLADTRCCELACVVNQDG
jgi:hypothetical protein